jgi:hypothetical protein
LKNADLGEVPKAEKIGRKRMSKRIVKADEAPDPTHAGFFGAVRMVLSAQELAHLIERFLRFFT